jgi:ribonuclease G
MRYKRWVHIEKDTSMGVTEFKFLNREGEEIQLTA